MLNLNLNTVSVRKESGTVPPPPEPTAISTSRFFYAATGGSSYVNQGTSGFTASNGTIGSGTGADITYVAGSAPYWNITTPNPATEVKFINSNEDTAGNATAWTALSLHQQPDLTKNRLPLHAQDSSTDRATVLAASSVGQMAGYYGDASSRVELFAPIGTLVANQWILTVITYNGALGTNRGKIYVNSNSALATNNTSKTINVSNDFTVGISVIGSTTVDNTMKTAAFGFWKTAISDAEVAEFMAYFSYYYGFTVS